MDCLVFRLYGAMASWGEIAVGESRHTADHPSKSAILGLLAAALGIKRDEDDKQLALANDLQMAICQLTAGNVLRDYHTSQAPDSVGKYKYKTRREELVLGKSRLGTVLSSREYLTDSLCLVAITLHEQAMFSLDKIKQALLKPEFHLYLGRKSCPLSLPLSPELKQDIGCYMDAFHYYEQKNILPCYKDSIDHYYLSMNEVKRYYWEGSIDLLSENLVKENVQTLVRQDQVRSRKRWQFGQRLEHFYQESTTGSMS